MFVTTSFFQMADSDTFFPQTIMRNIGACVSAYLHHVTEHIHVDCFSPKRSEGVSFHIIYVLGNNLSLHEASEFFQAENKC
jgi:hypothetical protein